ncbi:hypothetical protein, partial [Pseudomonas lurida]|uniref:hypothetical protein n=1 Tax=Pseudomonas lurida TaxID=244566 RepID=UPI0030DB3F08
FSLRDDDFAEPADGPDPDLCRPRVKPAMQKYSALPKFGIVVCGVSLRPKEEGRIAIVTNAGRTAVDAGFIGAIFGPAGRLSRERDLRAQRAMKPAYGKIVWSWRPVAGAKPLR